jgi:phosphoserine aminotransferase
MIANLLNQLNFSGGPGVLPESVLQQVQQSIYAVPEVGLSILGISHRSDWFRSVITELKANIRQLLGLPDDYHVLFLQGGATQQFSMIPMTLLAGRRQPAEYLHTGYWSGKALPEARREGAVQVLWNGESCGFNRLPRNEELTFSAEASYLHYTSNETVEGLQFHRILGHDNVPRICDMSSDFLSEPGEFDQFSMIYAHAQKNIGPSGVTVVIVKDDLLQNAPDHLPGFLDYRQQIESDSIFNTPPVFAIYVVLLVTRWLRDEIGGLKPMGELNAAKANLLYAALDQSNGFYAARAAIADRSTMNVTFRIADKNLEQAFINQASTAGFSGLAGHRSVGGIRASLYNGMQLPAVEKLVGFMDEFRMNH